MGMEARNMGTARTTDPGGRRAHLRVVDDSAPIPHATRRAAVAPSDDERRVLEHVAAELRRNARQLPTSSPLRAELLETAIYFEAAGG
jgi:hypothetical protein